MKCFSTLAGLAGLVLATLATAATAATASTPLGMAANCNAQTAQLTRDHRGLHIGMYCNNDDTARFGYNWSWIPLDLCLANRGGHLAGRRAGLFSATCGGCRLHHPRVRVDGPYGHTALLQCACLDAHRRSQWTQIDLDHILVDVNGALGCYGMLGNRTHAGPLPPLPARIVV